MAEQTLGQRIAEQRKKLGLSQEALGEKMCVSRQAISKWESDGAIPEIDKLIALSRLFGVSVGWLLGEEAAQEPEPASARTAPVQALKSSLKNQLADHPWWRTAAWIIIALSAVFMAWTSFLRVHKITQAELEVSILHSEVDRLQHQVQQLEFILEAADHSGTLLAGYSFDLALTADAPEATVSFSAAPRAWAEEDQGYLCISGIGIDPIRIPCQWDGDSLSAAVVLPFADGYELYFVIEHPDGSRQLQLLPHSTLESLKASYAVTVHGSIQNCEYHPSDNTLRMEEAHYSWNRSNLYTGTPVTWQKSELILYLDGQEIWQQTEFDAEVSPDSTLTAGGSGRGLGKFQIDLGSTKLEPSQQLELKVRTQLSNGVTGEATIAQWTLGEDGKLA